MSEEIIMLKEENTKLKAKLKTILELSKDNSDSFEYCLRDLENKLDKIEQICKDAPNIDSELSMRILEVIESEDK